MSEEIIDLKEFLERVQDDRDLLIELLDIYEQDFAEKRKIIEGAVQKRDFEQIKTVAHSLKGSSGNISAKPIHASFLKIEQLAKTSEINGIPETLKQIDELFVALKKFVVQLKQDLKK